MLNGSLKRSNPYPRVLTKSVQQHFLTCVFDAGLINKAHSTDRAIHCGKARRLAQQLEASPVTTGHQRGKRHQPHVHSILFKSLVGCCRSFQPATQQQLQLVASSAKQTRPSRQRANKAHRKPPAIASTNSWTVEIVSPVVAPRLFRAAVMDWQTLAPKVASHAVAEAGMIFKVRRSL